MKIFKTLLKVVLHNIYFPKTIYGVIRYYSCVEEKRLKVKTEGRNYQTYINMYYCLFFHRKYEMEIL
jgi:hypothetical protein